MMNSIEEICLGISQCYEERKAAPLIANIIKRIREGGTYRDIYEYIRELGLGDILRDILTVEDWNEYRTEYKLIAQSLYDVMKAYSQDINDLAEIVQKSVNEQLGINLKAQTVTPNNNFVNAIISGAVGENGNINTLATNMIDLGVDLTDRIIMENARLQAESGFKSVIVRRYDDVGLHNYANYSDSAKRHKTHPVDVCTFCKEREGTWDYEQTKKDKRVYQRHKGCTCSIDHVAKGYSIRLDNYVREKTFTPREKKEGAMSEAALEKLNSKSKDLEKLGYKNLDKWDAVVINTVWKKKKEQGFIQD